MTRTTITILKNLSVIRIKTVYVVLMFTNATSMMVLSALSEANVE